MTQKVSEMNLPVISVPPMAVAGGVETYQPGVAPDDASTPYEDPSIVVGTPSRVIHDPATISIYPDSITPSGVYSPESPVVTFDIVFSVGVVEDGVSKTYRVVKRIGIDKCKLACDAECSAPVSIVEEKSEARKAEAAATAKRFRILAGLE